MGPSGDKTHAMAACQLSDFILSGLKFFKMNPPGFFITQNHPVFPRATVTMEPLGEISLDGI